MGTYLVNVGLVYRGGRVLGPAHVTNDLSQELGAGKLNANIHV